MKYIAYCRKSTDEKDKQVLSIDQQIAELKEFALREHLEVIEFVTEAKTAKIPGREKFGQLLRRIEKGEAQGIVAWHPDRLARNSIDGGRGIYLLDTGKLVDLKFPQFWFESTPQGKFMLNIAFGQSKYYVDNLSENVKRGMRHKLRLGIWPVKAPIGYINDSSTRTIQLDSEKSKVIRRAFEYFSQGEKGFTDIANFMHKLGVTSSRSNKPMKIDYVKEMLSNRFYIGIMKYGGEYYDGTHKKFISKELFDKVQKRINQILKPRKTKHDFAFNQLIKCGECGASITGEVHNKYYKRTNRAASYIYYRCTKKLKPCLQKPVTEQDLELQIRKVVDDVAFPQSWANDWYKWLDRDEILEKEKSEENIQRLKTELETQDKKLNLLLDSYLDQVIDAETYKNKKNEIFDLKIKINEEITKIQNSGSSWLEPFREWVGSALSCAKIARTKNTCSDLAIGAKTVGSNFFLTDRRLAVNYEKPFAALCATPPAQRNSSSSVGDSFSVPRRGLEPPCLTAQDPKSSPSTISPPRLI